MVASNVAGVAIKALATFAGPAAYGAARQAAADVGKAFAGDQLKSQVTSAVARAAAPAVNILLKSVFESANKYARQGASQGSSQAPFSQTASSSSALVPAGQFAARVAARMNGNESTLQPNSRTLSVLSGVVSQLVLSNGAGQAGRAESQLALYRPQSGAAGGAASTSSIVSAGAQFINSEVGRMLTGQLVQYFFGSDGQSGNTPARTGLLENHARPARRTDALLLPTPSLPNSAASPQASVFGDVANSLASRSARTDQSFTGHLQLPRSESSPRFEGAVGPQFLQLPPSESSQLPSPQSDPTPRPQPNQRNGAANAALADARPAAMNNGMNGKVDTEASRNERLAALNEKLGDQRPQMSVEELRQALPVAPQHRPGGPSGDAGASAGTPGTPQGGPNAPQGGSGTPQSGSGAPHGGSNAPQGGHGTPPGPGTNGSADSRRMTFEEANEAALRQQEDLAIRDLQFQMERQEMNTRIKQALDLASDSMTLRKMVNDQLSQAAGL